MTLTNFVSILGNLFKKQALILCTYHLFHASKCVFENVYLLCYLFCTNSSSEAKLDLILCPKFELKSSKNAVGEMFAEQGR